MASALITRLRCDLCGALVTKITNCPCGCGVATCGKCGTYYHIVQRKQQRWTA